mgnify:CR=1 FL=1|jgi:uncharacterized protein YoxC
MKLEKKLHEELMRYRSINNYGKRLISEQEEPLDLPDVEDELPAEEPVGDAPAEEPVGDAEMAELPAEDEMVDDEVPMDDTADADVEEIDITDLVNMTQNIKNDLDSTKSNNDQVIGKMDDLFSKLDDLEGKLSQMDNVISKIDGLETKVENMKEPTAVERLEMRSIDSYPFNQKPSDFFSQKQLDMKASGKNEYVISKEDVSNYNDKQVRDSFTMTNNDENEVEW